MMFSSRGQREEVLIFNNYLKCKKPICVALRLLQPPVFENGRKDYRSCRNGSLPLILAGIINQEQTF